MVQKPKSRRSKSTRKPVTIDLEASEVKTESETGGEAPRAEPVAFENATGTTDGQMSGDGKPAEASPEPVVPKSKVDEDAREAIEGGEGPSPDPEPVPSAPPGGSGRFAAIGGGVIGGLVALLLAGGLQWAGVLPSMRSAEPVDLSPLQGQIDALSSELEAVKGAAPSVPADLAGRVESAQTAATANGEALAGLQEQFAALDDRVASLNQAVSSGGAGENAGLEALSERADAIEATLSDLSGKVATLDAAPSDDTAGEADTALRGEVADAMQAAQSAADGVADLRSEIETLSAGLAEARSSLAALGNRVSGVETDIEAGAGSRVAAAIAASALKSAADRGGGFMNELEAYAAVSDDAQSIEALRDYAASGVPTQAQLTERFPAVANVIVAAQSGVGSDAGILDRLSASARSLVQIRPVGEVAGDKPGEIAARMEVALQQGDFDRVVTEWESLPEASQQASADFIADVKARRELDTLISRVLSGAMQAGEAPASE
ncbi:mitofilin family membrane protein [Oricola indica]|uniref:COG4223 family protein n=1 Tax=Oricola indica TaxID=2872591 RepID=UPI003CCB806B